MIPDPASVSTVFPMSRAVALAAGAFVAGALAAAALLARRHDRRRRHRAWVRRVGFRSFEAEMSVAIDLALRCGENMRQTLGATAEMKGEGDKDVSIDPVTATDRENERLCMETLAQRFPHHAVVGE